MMFSLIAGFLRPVILFKVQALHPGKVGVDLHYQLMCVPTSTTVISHSPSYTRFKSHCRYAILVEQRSKYGTLFVWPTLTTIRRLNECPYNLSLFVYLTCWNTQPRMMTGRCSPLIAPPELSPPQMVVWTPSSLQSPVKYPSTHLRDHISDVCTALYAIEKLTWSMEWRQHSLSRLVQTYTNPQSSGLQIPRIQNQH